MKCEVDSTAYIAESDQIVREHPVDIIVGTKSRVESRKGIPSVENDVYIDYQKWMILVMQRHLN